MESQEELRKKAIPPQETGVEKNIDHRVTAPDENDARKLFMIGRNRLVDVNHWSEYSRPVTATFRLTDANGNEVDRTAQKGDYFKIDLPGPGSVEGKGYDWVRIEAVEDKSDAAGPAEFIALRVRPAPNPTATGENVAHFFSDAATSSFVIERNGREVKAAVYSRNEVPNTSTSNVIDKVRNAVVGTGAIAGFSDVQWRNLVTGLIDSSPPETSAS